MNRIPRLLLALAATASLAAAQTMAPTPTPPPAALESADASGVLLAPKRADYVPAPATDSDGVARTVSPGIAAALADGMPKFNPPTPTPAVTAEPQDLRDIDKPKNEIPRLPKYVVHESRPPVFRDRDLYTPEGLVALSFKNHPGLAIGNILGLNEGPARDMWFDDQRLASISDLDDTAHAMAQGGDKAEASYILQETQDTFMRSDFTNSSGPVQSGGLSGGGGK